MYDTLKLSQRWLFFRCTNGTVCGVLHQHEDVWSVFVVPSGNRRTAAKVSKHPCNFPTVNSDVDWRVSLTCRSAILAAAENFTVLIKNSIMYPKFNFHRSVSQCAHDAEVLSRVHIHLLPIVVSSGGTYSLTSGPRTSRAVNTTKKRTLNAPYSCSNTWFQRLERTFKTWLWRSA